MIKTLKAKDFKAVPYLETSALMQSHPNGLRFSENKPNVIVGPNGSGKSACLKSLALLTLSWLSGRSTLDKKYTSLDQNAQAYWAQEGSRWEHKFVYLPGLHCTEDQAPALYYRPGAKPGDEEMLTVAAMCGYAEEVKHYEALTKHKSSGQQGQALLQQGMAALSGDATEVVYRYANWQFSKKPLDLAKQDGYVGDWDYQAEILKKRVADCKPTACPVLLLDEPEQSLDAKAELLLWKAIEAADPSRVQVIVAAHSLYPLLHPKKFNIIEAVPGYAAEVRALL